MAVTFPSLVVEDETRACVGWNHGSGGGRAPHRDGMDRDHGMRVLSRKKEGSAGGLRERQLSSDGGHTDPQRVRDTYSRDGSADVVVAELPVSALPEKKDPTAPVPKKKKVRRRWKKVGRKKTGKRSKQKKMHHGSSMDRGSSAPRNNCLIFACVIRVRYERVSVV